MDNLCTDVRPRMRRAWRALWLLVVVIAGAVGCAEKPVEKPAADVEKGRQEHIEMMQRESGQAPAPENG